MLFSLTPPVGSGLQNLTNENTGHTVKLEFQINTDVIVMDIGPVQHFLIPSSPEP